MAADRRKVPLFVLEAPDGRTVKRLATLCGVRVEAFRRDFRIRHLFDERPGRWDARRAERAGKQLEFQPGELVVGVGLAGPAIGCEWAWNTVTNLPSGARLFYLTSPALAEFWDHLPTREAASGHLRHFLGLS